MSRIGDAVARAVGELCAGLDNPVLSWKAGAYTCTPKQASASLRLTAGGLSPEVDAVFILSRSQFNAEIPKAKEFCAYAGKTYVIVSVDTDATGSFLVLHCDEKGKGA